MNFTINPTPDAVQTQVVFDMQLDFNTVKFIDNNLHIGIKGQKIKDKSVKKIIQNLADIANKFSIKSLFLPTIKMQNFVKIATQTFANNNYQVQKINLKSPKPNALQSVVFSTGEQIEITQALAVVEGMNLAKTLGDMAPNVCTPSYLAQSAQDLADKFNLTCEILEATDMATFGMHSLLSVSKGSIEPPKLITLSYQGAGNAQPIVLVGKGVTFDSGGISLKPGAGMDEMKYDMCGAASVLGAMHSVASLGLRINLTVIVPAVENMPAHNASKPGDVVRSMSGQTIEILNTDAEGRLILCDALTYAAKFNPMTVIDVATLTGAVIVALGKHHSGLMSNDEDLAQALISAGKASQDTLWQLPLDEEFDEQLHSNFADMANIGGREAGSITAGCFLARFTKDYQWAHLDIAGTAWHSGKNKGATGRPVALLTQFIMDKAT
jgi:leucyl aminopeptidase